MSRFKFTSINWVFVAVLTAGALVVLAAQVDNSEADGIRIASFMRDLDEIDLESLSGLEPLPVLQYVIPEPSVHVMRAQLEETYSIDGVGQDTVELSGWIAVKHGRARPAAGETEITWETAVIDTEFLGLKLNGYSEVFGPVEIRLDKSQPAKGQVGRIEIPDLAVYALVAELDKHDESSGGDASKTRMGGLNAEARERLRERIKANPELLQPVVPKRERLERAIGTDPNLPMLPVEDLENLQLDLLRGGACVAPLGVEVSLPQIGLRMKTDRPVLWYSLVDTIPPVGHTASVTIEPIPLISEGRIVGKLVSGKVKFREVVRDLPLYGPFNDSSGDQIAAR